MTTPVLSRPQIEAAVSPELVVDSVRATLIAHAEGRTTVPPPIHLAFPASDADAHVKAGWVDGAADFAVKIASGSYRNPERGVPTNHGLVVVLSAETGQVRAVLDDEGMLTAWRTAAAGALATDAMARTEATTVGVFGTGEQARLQVTWLARLRPVSEVLVHGRDVGRAATLAEWFGAQGLAARPASAADAAGAELVLTTTPATAPVLAADDVRAGTQVTGIGTDMPHKNELPAELLARAATIATDDHEQCLHHGDFGVAVRAGAVREDADVSLGAILRDGLTRSADAITVADLTGLGAVDAALASRVVQALLA